MADDDDLDLDVEAPKKGGGNLWKIIALVVVGLLVIGLSIGITVLLLKDSGGDNASSADATEETKQEAQKEDEKKEGGATKTAIYIPIKPAFVVNISDPDSDVNYLQVAVTLMVNSEADQQKVELHLPTISQHLVLLFGDQQFSQIQNSEGKRRLIKEALGVVQNAMKDRTGDKVVEDLLITNIVGQ